MTLTLAAPPFTKKRAGAHYVWADDLTTAYAFAVEWGLSLQLTDAPYQVAKLVGPDVRLVIYPHKTSAGHRHLRVRDENSKNARRAQALMALLDRAAGFNCTFSFHWPVNNLAHQLSHDVSEAGLRMVRALAAEDASQHGSAVGEVRDGRQPAERPNPSSQTPPTPGIEDR